MSKSKKRKHTKWVPRDSFAHFIYLVYQQAELPIPDEFYPEDEAPRIVDALRAQGMGIKLD
jgi:hypothetical protein